MEIEARFISFEGIDGCGKSTVLSQFGAWLEEAGIAFIKTREPGGTVLGEGIRQLLLDPAHKSMDPWAEVFLYTASRAQLVEEVIRPALQQGTWVLADRFIDATLAYQGYGRRLDLGRLRLLQEWATKGVWPHRTVLLDCDLQVAAERMRVRNGSPDRMELQKLSFHQRVREGYLALAESEPGRLTVLNTARPLESVLHELRKLFWEPLLEEISSRS